MKWTCCLHPAEKIDLLHTAWISAAFCVPLWWWILRPVQMPTIHSTAIEHPNESIPSTLVTVQIIKLQIFISICTVLTIWQLSTVMVITVGKRFGQWLHADSDLTWIDQPLTWPDLTWLDLIQSTLTWLNQTDIFFDQYLCCIYVLYCTVLFVHS